MLTGYKYIILRANFYIITATPNKTPRTVPIMFKPTSNHEKCRPGVNTFVASSAHEYRNGKANKNNDSEKLRRVSVKNNENTKNKIICAERLSSMCSFSLSDERKLRILASVRLVS